MTETYLYIKQHEITGLKYFGKTIKKDPYKYTGSGKHWLRHIKKHGIKHVKTIWCKLFTDINELQRVALAMSDMYDIVDSPFWANLTPENGLDGGLTKEYLSTETRSKMSIAALNISDEHRSKISAANKDNNHMLGKTHTEESKQKMSLAHKNMTFDTKQKMSLAQKGKIISEKTKQKISAANKGENHPNYGKNLSEDTRAKISAAQKGKSQPIITCPHCNKSGSVSNMKRWHFDNCKENTNG